MQDAVQSAVKRCKEYLSSYWDSPSKEVEEELKELSGDELKLKKSKGNLKSEENKVFPEREEKKEEHEWSWGRWKQHIGETEENERLLQALKVIPLVTSLTPLSLSVSKFSCKELIRPKSATFGN